MEKQEISTPLRTLKLEDEDVCVCVGACEERQGFLCRKILENRATVVVVLWDKDVSESVEAARDFVEQLRMGMGNEGVQFHSMSVEELKGLLQEHDNDCYGLVFLLGDDRLRNSYDFFRGTVTNFVAREGLEEDFGDVPDTLERLQLVTALWAEKLSDGMWPVMLLTGPSGVGKSFAARRIYKVLHDQGVLKGEFRHLNCGEFGKEDMNAALFGVVGQGFTGVKASKGAIGEAEDGVVFMDEIGTLPPELQPRLLTLLDKGEYRSHGAAGNTKKATCRFVFGTNEDLKKAVAEKRFRFDLYNRINGIRIDLPTLAERFQTPETPAGDGFSKRILKRMCANHGGLRFTRRAREDFHEMVRSHPWPGNFRDLGRLFGNLRMEAIRAGRGNIVMAATLAKVWAAFRREGSDDPGETFPSNVTSKQPERPIDIVSATNTLPMDITEESPLLQELTDRGANEKAMLGFAFRVASESPNCAEAGRRFYKGKGIKNPSSSFARYLGRYGFRWDGNEPGHIIRS